MGKIQIRKIRKSGGSLVVTIPSNLCKKFNLEEGTDLDLTVVGDELILKPKKAKMSVSDRIETYKEQGLKP